MSYLGELMKSTAALSFAGQSSRRERELRRELARSASCSIAWALWPPRTETFLSGWTQDRVLVTPTGFSKGMMRPEDMVVVDLHGKKLSGTYNPSSEIVMHLTIYRMRPDVGAVVHAHPCTATGFASAGIALDEPLCSEIVITLGAVPLAPYATTGTMELSDSLRPFIPYHDAILMANHGVVTYGEDLCRAYMRMEAVEHYAKIVMTTRQLGTARSLGSRELEKLFEVRSQYAKNGH